MVALKVEILTQKIIVHYRHTNWVFNIKVIKVQSNYLLTQQIEHILVLSIMETTYTCN